MKILFDAYIYAQIIIFNNFIIICLNKSLEMKSKHGTRNIKKSIYVNNTFVLLMSGLMFKMFYWTDERDVYKLNQES